MVYFVLLYWCGCQFCGSLVAKRCVSWFCRVFVKLYGPLFWVIHKQFCGLVSFFGLELILMQFVFFVELRIWCPVRSVRPCDYSP